MGVRTVYTFVNPKTLKKDHYLRLPPSSAQEGIKNIGYLCWISSVISLAGSVTDQGCFSRMQGQKDSEYPDPHQRIFGFFFNILWIMIRDVHPGTGYWFFTHPGSRVQEGTGSAILDFSPVCPCDGSLKSHLKKFDNSISLPFLCNTSKWTFYF